MTTNQRPRAIIYVRVSTTEQAETDIDGGYSLPLQLRECRKKAKDLNAVVVGEYQDAGASARSTKRPELQAALARIEAEGDVDLLIVHKVDRFARDALDALVLRNQLNEAGVQFVSVSEHFDDTAYGRFNIRLSESLAQLYSDRLSEEVGSKMNEKARRGGTPGKVPIGYINVRKEVDGIPGVATVEVDEDRAHHVRWAFKTYASGNWTISQLTEALKERGLRTKATRKLPEKPLGRATVHNMLRNPYYVGVVVWGGQIYPNGRHPKLITPEVFDKVQTILDANDNGGSGYRYLHYLKGTIRCHRCKSRLGFIHGRGNGGEYLYFYCLGRQQRKGCDLPYLPVDKVVAEVEAYQPVIRRKLGERIDALVAALNGYLGTYEQRAEEERRDQQRRLGTLDRQEEKLLQQYYDEAVSEQLYKKEQKRIAVERARATDIISATQLQPDEIRKAAGTLRSAVHRADELYQALPDDLRRIFNQFWFSSLELDTEGVIAHTWGDFPRLVDNAQLNSELVEEHQRFARSTPEPRGPRTTNPAKLALAGNGSKLTGLVDRTGLEPVTFRV